MVLKWKLAETKHFEFYLIAIGTLVLILNPCVERNFYEPMSCAKPKRFSLLIWRRNLSVTAVLKFECFNQET